MNFKRKRQIKGRSAKTYKEWYSDCDQYRISWRSEAFEVTVDPGYHACVRSGKGWGFAQRRGLYRTLKAAKDACELNWKLWSKFISIEGRTKVTQIGDLRTRAMIGKGNQAYSGMSDLPVWVEKKASPRLLEIIRGRTCSQSDPTKTWGISEPSELTPCSEPSLADSNQDGPASTAGETELVSLPGAIKADGTRKSKTPAPGVKDPVQAPRKRLSKCTTKKSKRGKKKSRRGKKSKSVRKRQLN